MNSLWGWEAQKERDQGRHHRGGGLRVLKDEQFYKAERGSPSSLPCRAI